MPYATLNDLQQSIAPDLLLHLADDDADGVADEALLLGQLAAGAATIDHYLAGRYITPVNPAPQLLAQWNVDLALEALHLRRTGTLPADLADHLALARRALQAISDGLVGLALAQPRPADYTADCTRLGEDPVFGDEALAEF